MINRRIEEPLYRFIEHKIIETPGAILHAIGGIETHVHIASNRVFTCRNGSES